MQFINFITKETLVKLDLYISILIYLKDKSLYFIELLNSNKKKNKYIIRLNTTIAILNNNQQLNLSDLNDLKAQQTKKKKKKLTNNN